MKLKLVLLAVAVLAVGGYIAYKQFAPEGSTVVHQELPSNLVDNGASSTTGPSTPGADPNAAAGPTPIRQGSFTGADDFHYARGTVALYATSDGGHVLRFEGYDARDGPDIYLYLTKTAGASSTDAVEGEGLKLTVQGGEADGRATLRGEFNVQVPAGTDVTQYQGVTIWCEQFNHYFGSAPLA